MVEGEWDQKVLHFCLDFVDQVWSTPLLPAKDATAKAEEMLACACDADRSVNGLHPKIRAAV